jgi:transcription termination/antitermination protein NusA
MSVVSHQEGVDPIGSCVGQRGTRIQAVLAEIGTEKIDIIPYDKDPAKYIKNALSPAKTIEIKLDEKDKRAQVYVDEDQLSLAIGKQGQNVRLASKLAGYEIDILESGSQKKPEKTNKTKEIKKTKGEGDKRENKDSDKASDKKETPAKTEKKSRKKKKPKRTAKRKTKTKTKAKTKTKTNQQPGGKKKE